MIAVPAETAVTTPLLFTVATDVLLLDQVTFWLVAFSGEIVAVSTSVSPMSNDAVVGLRETPVTETSGVSVVYSSLLLQATNVTSIKIADVKSVKVFFIDLWFLFVNFGNKKNVD